MRAKEFISKLFEAEAGGFYTIGDSHAVAVAQAGGKSWTNLAIGGKSSTDSSMLANIAKIPKGAVVLVSQGANDTANASRAHIDSNGKTPLKPAATIASNVAAVVNKVKAQSPSQIIFLLFPNGPGRGAGLAKYYGGDYQEEVRNAIKSAVGVTVIDLNGKPLTDGVHATMASYRDVANQVVSKYKPNTTTAATDKEASKEATPFTVEVPDGKRGPLIADAQKALEALGVPLPKYGVDGIQGKETTGAIKTFQEKNGLEATGIVNQQTAGKMNAMLKAKPEVLAKLTKSTNKDVKSLDYSRGAEEVAQLTSDASVEKARAAAEEYLGAKMSDQEWNYLLRATTAEASNNSKEQAYVMGVILNRTRMGNWGPNVISVLRAPNQFQAVTGTRFDPGPSSNFTRGPNDRQLANIVDGAINILPQVPKDLKYFTAASSAAYGAGTNIGFRDRLLAKGGEKIGGTIFSASA